jgi:hypothetical protein
MRVSVPSICVEIYQIPRLRVGDGFRRIFAYAVVHVPRTRKLEARRGPVQGLSRKHAGARRVCASPANRCQVSALRRAQTLPTIGGVPGPAVPLDDPEASSYGRWASGVMTPRFKGKPNFDLSQLCPLCAYKIQPNELVRLASHVIKCPKCGGAFDEMGTRKPMSTS